MTGPTAATGPTTSSGRAATAALLGPLALIALACGLWWISDRLLYVGPLDRATFGWAIVVPVWCLSAVAAAFAGSRITRDVGRLVVVTDCLVIAAGLGLLIWSSFDAEACEFGPRVAAVELIAPALLVGLALGGVWAMAALMGRSLVLAGRPWSAGFVAIAIALGDVIFTAVVATLLLLNSAGCNRPPV